MRFLTFVFAMTLANTCLGQAFEEYQICLTGIGFSGDELSVSGIVTIDVSKDQIQSCDLLFQRNSGSLIELELQSNGADDSMGGTQIDFVEVGDNLFVNVLGTESEVVFWDGTNSQTGESCYFTIYSSAFEQPSVSIEWASPAGADIWADESPGPNGFVLNQDMCNVMRGDVNMDGQIDLLDVVPFVELLGNGNFQAEADINEDGVVSLLDVEPFVELLSDG